RFQAIRLVRRAVVRGHELRGETHFPRKGDGCLVDQRCRIALPSEAAAELAANIRRLGIADCLQCGRRYRIEQADSEHWRADAWLQHRIVRQRALGRIHYAVAGLLQCPALPVCMPTFALPPRHRDAAFGYMALDGTRVEHMTKDGGWPAQLQHE